MIHGAAGRFTPVTLDELAAGAALLTRVDTKYLVDVATFELLTGRLADRARVLEIDGRRVFTYDTVYFDSDALLTYRAHTQRRRRRFKCRSRRYVETGLHVFEVKLKGRRGCTVKRQLPADPAMHALMTERSRAFLDEVLTEAYGAAPGEALHPALGMTYRRMTLASTAGSERVTCDFGLSYRDGGDVVGGLRDDVVIVETKSEHGRGPADRELRRLGARPVSVSKYCTGIALARPEVTRNHLLRQLRFFTPSARRSATVPPLAVAA